MVSWITPSVLEAQYEAENGTHEDILEAAHFLGLFIHSRTLARILTPYQSSKCFPESKIARRHTASAPPQEEGLQRRMNGRVAQFC